MSMPPEHDAVSLSDYLGERDRLPQGLDGVLADIAAACCQIAALVRRGELAGVLGAAGAENVQGEDQKKLDVIANEILLSALAGSTGVTAMASEEMEHHSPVAGAQSGGYLVAFDPLDGSSNIDVNGSTGTIFSVTRHAANETLSDQSFLQAGHQQLAAGYCLYSSACLLVLTVGEGVVGFTLDDERGAFALTYPDVRIGPETSEFAINAAYQRHWFPPVSRYIDECLAGEQGVRGRNFNMRWAGSMVGDIHRILCRGGVFLYPADHKLEASGQTGKLRLLYEANPMGLLIEQAGGLAHTGDSPILELEPSGLHQRVPVLMGAAREVERLVEYHRL